ncbi:MAG: transporter [Austwickia sp.]|jgi:hypothetical protein|nr:transporter [Austwickia sp.]
MGAVGLFYVGAVLIVNGLMLLGYMSGPSAAPLNLFVGALQVVVPTLLLIRAGSDTAGVFAASGLYLFGFTYLWVGINALANLPGHGLGWYSLFVAVAALGYSWHAFTVESDPAFGVIWLLWAALWGLFFLLLGLERAHLAQATGVVALVEGIVTAAVPAFLILSGSWTSNATTALVLALVGLATIAACVPLGRRLAHRSAPVAA